jgi:hypothetical protein
VRPLVPRLAAASFLVASACVAYRPAPVSTEGLLAEAATPPTTPLTFEDAVRFALEHDPDLRALRARAAAVNPRRVPEPVGVDAGVDMMRRPEAGLMLDATSILGIGPAGGDRALARARVAEAVLRHHERAWEVAASIAESRRRSPSSARSRAWTCPT